MTEIGVLGSQVDMSMSMSESEAPFNARTDSRSSGEAQMVMLSVRSSSSVEDTAVEEVDESEGVRQCEIRIGFEGMLGIIRAR